MAKSSKQEQSSDSKLSEKVLYINRCSKVVKGGRKFSFSALILVSNDEGAVGFGFAKANELSDAIKKGGDAARKHLEVFPLEKTSIPHEVFVKWDGASILFKPTPEGSGVVAGSQVRSILEACGYKNVMAKSLGSNNPINLVRATFKALRSLRSHSQIEERRRVVS